VPRLTSPILRELYASGWYAWSPGDEEDEILLATMDGTGAQTTLSLSPDNAIALRDRLTELIDALP
jgi:hypothetical protein